jgi:hypothetical protein
MTLHLVSIAGVGLAPRTCHDCGDRDGPWATPRRPRRTMDLCTDCQADRELRGVERARVDECRREMAAARAAGRAWHPQEPVWTAPLFRELRP